MKVQQAGRAEAAATGLDIVAALEARAELELGVTVRQRYDIECYGSDGKLKWRDYIENLVVDEGLDLYLDQLTAAAVTLSVGLTDGTPTVAAGDTMASHAGWVEVTAYSEATRDSPTFAAASSQSRDNSGDVSAFSINGTATVGGAFIATNNTKGGSTGVLLGGGAFTQGDKAVDSGDTLNVTMTITMAAA